MRPNDWPRRLNRAIERARDTPFDWGTHDCCCFVGDVVLAIAGWDPAAPFRGRYATSAEADRVMDEFCPGGLEAVALQLFGEPREMVFQAARGDVALIRIGRRTMLGIVTGRHIACAAPSGLGFLSLDRAALVWPI